MSDRLEDELRKALRPVDPAPMFAERVMARIQQVRPGSQQISRWTLRSGRRRWARPRFWLPATLVASLVIAVSIRHELQLRREADHGRIAREQLLEALRLTSEKLEVAYRAARGGTAPALIVVPANPAIERDRGTGTLL